MKGIYGLGEISRIQNLTFKNIAKNNQNINNTFIFAYEIIKFDIWNSILDI